MKRAFIIVLLFGLLRMSYSQISKERYFEQSIELIRQFSPEENYIVVHLENGNKYESEFLSYQGDSVFVRIRSTGEKLYIPLYQINSINTKNGTAVFLKSSYENLYGKLQSVQNDSLVFVKTANDKGDTKADTQTILDTISEKSLIERQTIAQERIALVATYFMILSVTSIVISILIIL